MWWHGPCFIQNKSQQANCLNLVTTSQPNLEILKLLSNYLLLHHPKQLELLIENSSSFMKTLRSTICLYQFLLKLRFKSYENAFTLIQLQHEAERLLIRLVQAKTYKSEIRSLQDKKPISPTSKIFNFCPTLQHDDILRIGGRISQSKLPFEAKFQAILPPNHPLTSQIIRHTHLRLLHAGTQQVMTAIRQRYWIASLRRNVKNSVRKCIPCFKQKRT